MPSVVVPSLKVTEPVGAAPRQVAANVTVWPAALGLSEEATVTVAASLGAVLVSAKWTVARPAGSGRHRVGTASGGVGP